MIKLALLIKIYNFNFNLY